MSPPGSILSVAEMKAWSIRVENKLLRIDLGTNGGQKEGQKGAASRE